MPSRAKPTVVMPPPPPDAIVSYYPDPRDVARAYVDRNFAQQLGPSHERMIAIVTSESPEVTDGASYQRVGELLVEVVDYQRHVSEWFAPVRTILHKMHAMVCERERAVLAPLVAFETAAKENRKRLERAEAEARRREEQRLAEEARQQEQERLMREAADLEQRNEPDLAAQVLEHATRAPAPVITLKSTLPPTRGILPTKPKYAWRPVGGDTMEGRARAVKLVPREFLCLDEVKLNAYARMHGTAGRIPGIEFYDVGSVTVRT